MSVTETGCREPLLISLVIWDKTLTSLAVGKAKPQAVLVVHEDSDWKGLAASWPSTESDSGPLKLTPKQLQGEDCGLASLRYSWCQVHVLLTPSTHHPHANRTISMCHPQVLHILPTNLPHATTYYPYAFHMPFAGHLFTIHIPSSCHLTTLYQSSSHRLHATSMLPLTCHVPFTHTHVLAIRCAQHPLPDENPAPGQDPRTYTKPSPSLTWPQAISFP